MNRKKLEEILNDNSRAFNVRRDNSEEIVDKEFIKNLRTKHNYTQVVFSSILGVSVKTIEKWEQGAIKPRSMVKKFLYLLDIHPYLFNDLYSYKSHESSKIVFVNKLKTNKSFADNFKKNRLSKTSDNISFNTINDKFTQDIKQNDLMPRDCCPAS